MTLKHYERVLPRDLFNEANLLKCLGRLFLLCDDAPKDCTLVHTYSDRPFHVSQDDATGAITCVNIYMYIGDERILFWRPLNSREPWPLYIEYDDECISVFDDNGNLTPEFKEVIKYGN